MTKPTTPHAGGGTLRTGPDSGDPLDDDRRCKALSRRSGQRCKRFPIPGGTVCVMHGGAAPAVRAAAERRNAEAAATALLEVIWDRDSPPVTDPIGSLRRLAGRLEHAADVLGARLEGESLDGPTALAWSRVLREQRQALEGMARFGIAEQHAALETARVRLMAQAVVAVFEALGLSAEQRALGTRVLFAELRAGEARPVVAGEVER